MLPSCTPPKPAGSLGAGRTRRTTRSSFRSSGTAGRASAADRMPGPDLRAPVVSPPSPRSYNWIRSGDLFDFGDHEEEFAQAHGKMPKTSREAQKLRDKFLRGVEEARELLDRRRGKQPATEHDPLDFTDEVVSPGLVGAGDGAASRAQAHPSFHRSLAANPGAAGRAGPGPGAAAAHSRDSGGRFARE